MKSRQSHFVSHSTIARWKEQYGEECVSLELRLPESIPVNGGMEVPLRAYLGARKKFDHAVVLTNPAPPPLSAPFGLGDAVAVIAEPIASALDAVVGTKIKGCGGCARRREALNRAGDKVMGMIRG